MTDPTRSIVSEVDGKYVIKLNSREMLGTKLSFPIQPNGEPNSAELQLTSGNFYELLSALLEITQGDKIAFHLPSHGFGKHEQDLDQVEKIVENLFRILNELKNSTEEENSLVNLMIKRKAETMRLWISNQPASE